MPVGTTLIEVTTIDQAIMVMKDQVNDLIAQAYLEGLPAAVSTHGLKGLVVQMWYILENSKQWRGAQARHTKKFVKDWCYENKDPENRIPPEARR